MTVECVQDEPAVIRHGRHPCVHIKNVIVYFVLGNCQFCFWRFGNRNRFHNANLFSCSGFLSLLPFLR